jgi:hypothetical protein
MNKLFLIIAAITVIPFIQLSAQSPIQVALFNPIQIIPESNSVSGLRLNLIYGRNNNVGGIDLGLVNSTSGNQVGFQWGMLGLNQGDFTGWQYNFINVTNGNFLGLQTGFISYNSGKVSGLQFSLFNYAATLNGIQLGLINVIGRGGFLPVFPFFNFSFD